MKPLYLNLLCLITLVSCKSEQKTPINSASNQPLTIAQKIAKAHGYEYWKNVSEVNFTFKVDRDTIQGQGRSWTWKPKEDQVKMTAGDIQIDYTRHAMDSTHINTDRAFINDKFWLMAPFQLVWDTSISISEPIKASSPIGNETLNMISIVYPNEGGYTPGDAYDIFYDEHYIIKEWVYRQGNSEQASLSTTFENYKDYNGIKIATDHKMKGNNWNLNFADITIIYNDL